MPLASKTPGVFFARSRSAMNFASGSMGYLPEKSVAGFLRFSAPCQQVDANKAPVEKLIARMERRFGRHAPEGITLWIVGISGALHLLVFARPQAAALLWLDTQAVLRGEVWRVFTFLFAPTGPMDLWGMIWAGFWLLFLYTIGTSLEAQWGSFRFDLFFFGGAVGTLVVGFLLGPVPGRYVAEAMLLAFAVEFPDYEV